MVKSLNKIFENILLALKNYKIIKKIELIFLLNKYIILLIFQI